MDAAKHIVVTGVSQGLGLAITKACLEAGWTVHGVSRRRTPEFDELAGRHSGRVHFQTFDLGATDDVAQGLFQEFLPLRQQLDGLVNNAGTAYDDLITNLDPEALRRMYAVNVFTPMMIAKHFIRNLLFHRAPGAIVHVSSVSVHTGYKGLAMYASTKGALEAFSKNTAREWGERGVRSNCVVAGFMETAMSGSLSAEQKARIHQRTSLKEATRLESVAGTVRFLLSDEAASITGQNVFVDAGTI
jgi:3-oxoacyl-[acyl-carrier protein] reductase